MMIIVVALTTMMIIVLTLICYYFHENINDASMSVSIKIMKNIKHRAREK